MPLDRANMELRRALYSGPSDLRALDAERGTYCKIIGRGLFSRLTYRKDDRIIKFVGIVRSREEFDFLTQDSDPLRKNYCIYLSATRVLDCYDKVKVLLYYLF